MNNIIYENKKNTELVRNDIYQLNEQMNEQFSELKLNVSNKSEINYIIDDRNTVNKRVRYR